MSDSISCNNAKVTAVNLPQCPNRTLLPPAKDVVKACSRCNNLLKNPSFETDLSFWVTDNVEIADTKPFEGTAVARMGPGIASMFQDVCLKGTCCHPLLLSFQVYPSLGALPVGNLVVELLWLDSNCNVIGTGLKLLVPPERTQDISNRLTYVELTDLPPANAEIARLQFSKGEAPELIPDDLQPPVEGQGFDRLDIDQVILAPINCINLVQNSGFNLGLSFWNVDPAGTSRGEFDDNYEGTGYAVFDAVPSTDGIKLYQDVPVSSFPAGSAFLFSFAIKNLSGTATNNIKAQVIWLDMNNQVIGTGLSLEIEPGLINNGLDNYLTYVDVTEPSPNGAVTSRVQFVKTSDNSSQEIDKVILARVGSTNLVNNPSFENSFAFWSSGNATATLSADPYEKFTVARIDRTGGFIFQDIPLNSPSGRCFMLNFGYHAVGSPSKIGNFFAGDLIAEVSWLNSLGMEIGLGLSILVPSNTTTFLSRWLVYLGITEPAPARAVGVRVKFTKSSGNFDVDIDKVVLANLLQDISQP